MQASCVYRKNGGMRTIEIDNAVLDHLGGTSAVAALIKVGISTVHSWRTDGIPESRFDHITLRAKECGKPLPDDLAELLSPEPEADAA